MEAWDKFLKHLEADLGAATVLKWLHPLKIIRFDACNLYLEARDSFQINWFEEHVRPRVLSILFNNNKKRIKVHLTLAKIENSGLQENKRKVEAHSPANELTFDSLDPHFCFDEFIEPSDSPLPSRILSSLHAGEQPAFNPIYIFGESGRGKTHLLMSTAHQLQKEGLKVIYIKADTFTEHVVGAIRAGEMSAFRQAYRSADVLLVDDVQVFARKAATQEEFFHTFNTLHLAGKQIVIAANCSPSELPNIEPRLVSRFEWGIALSLSALNREELAKMLVNKANALKCPLESKMIEFLLDTFKSSTRSLIKALQALILRTHLNESSHFPTPSISVIQAAALLKDLITEEQKSKLTSEKIIQYVCEHFGLLTDDLLGKAQSRDKVLPRQIAMYFCRKELKLPFVKVGEIFSKDHSTVMSSVKLIQSAIDNSQHEVIASCEAIRKRFNS